MTSKTRTLKTSTPTPEGINLKLLNSNKDKLLIDKKTYADLMSYLAHMDQKKKEVEVSKKPATVKRVNQVGVTNINQ